MLSESEIESKISELATGDGIYLHGHAVKAGYAWEVVLKAPELKNWEAYQLRKADPAAQFALVQSMVVWCGSDQVATPAESKQSFAAVRARFVGVAEAITSTLSFQQFVGLEAHELEK
jgi:hypothetical protein